MRVFTGSRNIVDDTTIKGQYTHPGSGSDRTIANERQVTALAMLYIGRLVTCGIDYSFTPKTYFFSYTKKTQHKRVFGKEGKLYVCVTFWLDLNAISWSVFSEFEF